MSESSKTGVPWLDAINERIREDQRYAVQIGIYCVWMVIGGLVVLSGFLLSLAFRG